MSEERLSRRLYRAILHLHPEPFRERFGSEMLWIFDQVAPEAGVRGLTIDALVSVTKQWISAEVVPRPEERAFGMISGGHVSMATFAQAIFLASFGMLGFFSLLLKPVPLPQPPKTFEVRRAPLALSCEPISRHAR